MTPDVFPVGPDRDRRGQPRRALSASALFRERGRSKAPVEVIELSTSGCRVRLTGDIVSGEHGWVTLPSLGPWPCSVAWQGDAELGLTFDRPLHASVAEMLANRHA